MCGRTCCTLDKGLVPLACSAVLPDGQVPQWKDAPDGGEYNPSTNIPPTAYTPILVNGERVGESKEVYVIQPMLWGMVPYWHHGKSAKDHGLTTNNARLEGLKEGRLYKHAVKHSKRCVVICDGFYEWKTLDDKSKQPYFIYARQDSEDESGQLGSLTELKANDVWSESKSWTGPKPLFMAGLFSIWTSDDDPEGKKPVYSYSVITRDSEGVLDWPHDRMPVMLTSAEAVQSWLDPEVVGEEAVDLLKPIKKTEISWHAVSRAVGNVRNKGSDLAKKVELDKTGKAVKREADTMAKWLIKKPKEEIKKEEPDED